MCIWYPAVDTDLIGLTLAFFGCCKGFSDMYISILLPMTVADENRVLAYELTMLGTIFALVHLSFYLTTSLLAGLTVELARQRFKPGNIFNRIVVIILVTVSSYFFWIKARNQLVEVSKRIKRK